MSEIKTSKSLPRKKMNIEIYVFTEFKKGLSNETIGEYIYIYIVMFPKMLEQ